MARSSAAVLTVSAYSRQMLDLLGVVDQGDGVGQADDVEHQPARAVGGAQHHDGGPLTVLAVDRHVPSRLRARLVEQPRTGSTAAEHPRTDATKETDR